MVVNLDHQEKSPKLIGYGGIRLQPPGSTTVQVAWILEDYYFFWYVSLEKGAHRKGLKLVTQVQIIEKTLKP